MVLPVVKSKMNLAISGAGRIGRAVFRAFYQNRSQYPGLNLVSMNDPHDFSTLLHLLKYDSVHGPFCFPISLDSNPSRLHINGDDVFLQASRSPQDLPWRDLDVDCVLECSGRFKDRDSLSQHLSAGASKVILSSPSKGFLDNTVVLGANEDTLKQNHDVVSIGSCTTNALAPILKMVKSFATVNNCFFTTVHAYTKDQMLVDSHHRDLRRARAAAQSIIPTKTGASKAVSEVLPDLSGKVEGYALRVPTANVSLLDLVIEFNEPMNQAVVESLIVDYVNSSPVLSVNTEPLVSCDFKQNPSSAVIDLPQIQANGRTLRLVAWYDNEWAYALRMLDVASKVAALSGAVLTANL